MLGLLPGCGYHSLAAGASGILLACGAAVLSCAVCWFLAGRSPNSLAGGGGRPGT